MKKLFNYALLAAALLVGVNVNAIEFCPNVKTLETPELVTEDATPAKIMKAPVAHKAPTANDVVSVSISGQDPVYYQTFADAVSAIQKDVAGKFLTIEMKLLKDVEAAGAIKFQTQKLTLNLNNHTLSGNFYFQIFQSSLDIQGRGTITSTDGEPFYMIGYAGQNYGFSSLTIGKDVNVVVDSNYAIAIMPYNNGDASGVTVNIDGYVENLDGHGMSINGTVQKTTGAVPTINIAGTLKASNEVGYIEAKQNGESYEKAVYNWCQVFGGDKWGFTSSCIYAAGYAKWNITGTLEGGCGIYEKSGVFNLNGALVKATAAEYWAPVFYSNGFIGAGCAIVLDSNSDYGDMGEFKIANSTITSDNGYAIEETRTYGDDKLPDIQIMSGTFVGALGAITTTDEEAQAIKDRGGLAGGEWHNSNVNQYLDDYHTTLDFIDGNGKHYQVVVPIGADDWKQSIAKAAEQGEGKKYAYVGNNEGVEESTTVEFVRIADGKTVTVKEGATLDAGVLMTEGHSQIVVEAGATLIVSGEQGAYTFDENSLLVETSEDNPGLLLINPAVKLNTTPKSTVKFISKSYRNSADDKQFQYFGTPMVGEITSMTWDNATYQTQLDVWNGAAWDRIGVSDNDGEGFDYPKFNKGFGFYAILSNNPDDVTLTYTIQGNLAGNEDAEIALPTDWNAISNAYMGKLNKQAMLSYLKTQKENGLAGSVYEYEDCGEVLVWTATNAIRPGGDIDPMQPIMLFNGSGEAQNVDLNYADLVYNPATGTNPPAAPRNDDIMKATIRVKGCGMNDLVTIAEDGQFSSDFEDEFDAKKFDNKAIKFYVNADGEYDIYATDNIKNTFVGLNTTKAGKYTISFEDVTGNFALVDLKTNARIEMVEGTTYEFLAEAGEDAYRFAIVAGAQAPTDMQKTNAAIKTTKALINNQIVISNGERFFNVLGTEVK